MESNPCPIAVDLSSDRSHYPDGRDRRWCRGGPQLESLSIYHAGRAVSLVNRTWFA